MKVKLFKKTRFEKDKDGKVIKIIEKGYMPTRAHFDDAGMDLRSPINFTLHAHESKAIDFLVGFRIPIGYYGELKSKSGLNVKHNIQSEGGVLDSSFRGSVIGRVVNKSDEDYEFKRGDKVLQVVFIPYGAFELEETDDLGDDFSGRGTNGYGSSGR